MAAFAMNSFADIIIQDMKSTSFLLLLFVMYASPTQGQKLSVTPDFVAGHRSYTYMQSAGYRINDKVRLNNLVLFDTEYTNDHNNIFYIRNAFSYSLTPDFILHAAIGIKNPGAFFSTFLQFLRINNTYTFSYSIGATYQNGFTLEQSLYLECLPPLSDDMTAYFSISAIANIGKGYERGLQQIRMGIKQNKLVYGVAGNLDQFHNSSKKLENFGLFIKYYIK